MIKVDLKKIIFWLTVLTLLTPFLVSSNTYFPFIVTKATVFRILVEIMFLFYVLMLVRGEVKFRLNILTIILLIYGFAVLLSAFFGVNLIWSLLSGCERMEGVIGVWHFILFFLIITNVFQRTDFEKLLKIEIGISTIYGILSLLIYKGILSIGHVAFTPRLSGFTGNPSYLAAYFIFNCFFALYLYFETIKFNFNSKKTNWGHQLFPQNDSLVYLLIAVFDALLVLISGTRGGMIGLGIGLFFLLINLLISKDKSLISFKKLAIIVLGLIIVFLITVFSLKNTPLVKNNFALTRLTSISYKDPTGMSRILSAQTAFKSFLEKPILGWGIENYEPAYLKNFNPEVVKVLPGDFYFDRAHNKVMEVLATTGLVGFIPYIGIFVIIFWLLQKNHREENNFISSVIIQSLILAYFIQNIFLFDFHESYLMFFFTLAFIPVLVKSDFFSKEISFPSVFTQNQDFAPQLLKGFIVIMASCLVIVILFQVVLKTYFVSADIINLAKVLSQRQYDQAEQMFKTINYQIGKMDNLRKDLVIGTYNIFGSYNIVDEKAEPLMQELLKTTDYLLQKEPWNYRLVMNKLQLLMYESLWDKSKLSEAEQIRDQLIQVAPYFPQTYLASAKLNLILGQLDAAKLDLEKVLNLNPNDPIAHYFLGYYYLKTKENNQAIEHFVLALDNGYNFANNEIIQLLISFLAKQKDYQRVEKLYLQELQADPKNPEIYIHLAATYGKLHNKNKAIYYATKAMELEPRYKTAAESFIQIVQQGEWDKIPD